MSFAPHKRHLALFAMANLLSRRVELDELQTLSTVEVSPLVAKRRGTVGLVVILSRIQLQC